MKRGWFRVLALVLVFLMSASLLSAQAAKSKSKAKPKKEPAAVEQPVATWPAAELTVGFQTRDSETEGLGDLLIPVWNPGGDGLLFVNPRTAITDHDAEEGNLGVGYRQLLPKQNLILGANAYYDYRDTGYSHYDQWGFGLELLSPWIDARANYYDPENTKTVVASETQTTVNQSVRTSEGWGDPYADDHLVLQDYTITRTITTTTTTKTFEQYEQALGGYDWEIGLRLPIQSKALEARVFGGYYDFSRDFGDDASGWKARAEVRLLASLSLDAGLYENEELTGSDWFAGARLSVPLDFAKISQGRNPFSAAKARLGGEPRDFSARLTEMVMRDPQVRLETSKFLENKSLEDVEATQNKDKDSTTYVLLPDVQFVYGDATGAADGSAQHPFATIQQGANAVFGTRNVYVFNASGPYNENVVLQDGTTLWGGGSLIPGYGGKSFGSGIHPVVDGLSMGPSITMGNQTTVRGLSVRNTDMGGPEQWVMTPASHEISRVGIYGDNVTDLTLLDNILSGNTVGAQVFRSGDFNLLFQNNRVTANEGRGVEVWADGDSGGIFNADISRSLFSLNGTDPLYGTDGLLLFAGNYGESIASVRDSQFLDNPGMGMEVIQNGSSFAMALLSGLVAERNGVGIVSQQRNNQFSLVNISGSAANNNTGAGISNVQDSVAASVGIIGMPDGLDTSVATLASLFSLTLPEEVGLFLTPSGAVTANNNGGYGVYSEVASDGFLALGGLFDITANINQLDGIRAMNRANNGVAIGLAGSTENLADILQLGTDVAGLFDLDLPVSIPGGGQMQANGNGDAGFILQTIGGAAAINAVVGLDTIGNIAGPGTFVGTYSMVPPSPATNLAISALARLNTSDNGGAGLLFDVQALDDAAIGIIADVNASGNGDSGITASVDSPNGFAALLTLSTDLLRPVAAMLGEEFLDGPFELPGDPFGPIVASGNTGDGFNANVTGDGFAAAVFLDTWADNNTGNGFTINVVATNGPSIAAILSSDVALNLLNEMEVVPPIDFERIGYVSASGNGTNGIALTQNGTSGAYGILAGIRANDNVLGDGIHAALTSDDGSAYAILVDADAAGNGDDGIDLNLAADGYAISALLFSEVDGNGDDGVHAVQNSANADTFALLSNSEAWNNDGVGFWYNLNAANGDAAICATDTESDFNGARGAHFAITAGDTAALLVGTNAMPLFTMEFPGLGSAILETFWDVIPQGSSEFMGNGAGGLQADLTGGRVLVDVDGVQASNNTNNGINLALTGDTLLGRINDTDASHNGGNGINLEFNGGSEAADFWLSDLRAANNGVNGIYITENFSSTVRIGGERIVSTNNTGNGVRIVADGIGSMPVFDFGGGALGSLGLSSIYGNGNRDFRYNNGGGATVSAQSNWWGVGGGTFAGNVDHSNPLPSDPNAP